MPLKLLLLVEAVIALNAAFTYTDKGRSLGSLVFHITRNVNPHETTLIILHENGPFENIFHDKVDFARADTVRYQFLIPCF